MSRAALLRFRGWNTSGARRSERRWVGAPEGRHATREIRHFNPVDENIEFDRIDAQGGTAGEDQLIWGRLAQVGDGVREIRDIRKQPVECVCTPAES